MIKKPTLAIITITTGLIFSSSSQAFDLYAETDANTVAPVTAPANKTAQPVKNNQEIIRAKRNEERKERREVRKERMERRHEERREARKERMGGNNTRHNGGPGNVTKKSPTNSPTPEK